MIIFFIIIQLLFTNFNYETAMPCYINNELLNCILN